MNQVWWVTVTTFIAAVILLATGQWLSALFPLALGISLLVVIRRLRAAERMLDEAERQLTLEVPAANDHDANEDMNR
jgi:hypothetical protein